MKDNKDFVFMQKFAAMAIGNIMEWFDFSSFGALMDIIALNFFPHESDSSGMQSLAKAMVIFGVAFLMRPLGGIFMGWIGDTVGRKRALELSILLMMVPSFLIGCLPNFSQLGWAATVFLIILRSMQGLAAGGEIVGAYIFTMEAAEGKNLGFWGGACKATGILGNAIGIGLVAILRWSLSEQQMNSWGWRIPFWAGFLVGIVGLWGRKSLALDDTAHSHALVVGSSNTPIRAVLSVYKQNILRVILATAFWGCGYYTSFVWMAYFLEKKELFGRVNYVWIIMFSANLMLAVALPFGGKVGDYFQQKFQNCAESGWKLAMQASAIFMLIFAIPAFSLILMGNIYCVFVGLVLLTIPVAVYGGNLPAFMNSQFPYELRYTGIGMAYNISNAIFASTTSIVQTELVLMHLSDDRNYGPGWKHFGDNRLRPSYYLILIAILSFSSLFFTANTLLSSVATIEDNAHDVDPLSSIPSTLCSEHKEHSTAVDVENPLSQGHVNIHHK